MPDGGARERVLTADYNAEMIEQVFVGNPRDVVPDEFGDGLPLIGDWVTQNFEFSGYISGFDPADGPPRANASAPSSAIPARRAGLHRHGGWLRRGFGPAAPGD